VNIKEKLHEQFNVENIAKEPATERTKLGSRRNRIAPRQLSKQRGKCEAVLI
jgi:hypothetical protein